MKTLRCPKEKAVSGIPLEINPDKPRHALYDGIEYVEFWHGIAKDKLDDLEHGLLRELLPAAGQRLLDLGCGYGRLADCYLDRFGKAFFLDGSFSLLCQARERTGGQGIYIAADLSRLPFRDASFDAVVMVRVLHHIQDAKAILTEINRISAQGGKLIFNYSNKRNAKQFLRWLARRDRRSIFSPEPDGIGTTLISHHPRFIENVLHESSYSRLVYRGAGVMDKLAGGLGPLGRWVPTGQWLAPFLGHFKLAPWVFCRADAKGAGRLVESSDLADLLQCPRCCNRLIRTTNGFLCNACCNLYPIEENILDFRL